MKRTLGISLLIAANFCLAGNFIVAQYLAPVFPAWQLAFLRMAIGFLALLPFGIKLCYQHRAALWQHRWLLIAQGVVGFACSAGFGFQALHSTNAVSAGFIFAIGPFVILLFARLLLNEELSKRQFCGFLLSLLGVMGVISKGSISNLIHMQLSVGDLWMLGATLSFVFLTIMTKKYQTNIPQLATTLVMLAVASIFLLIPSLIECFLHQSVNTQGMIMDRERA